MTPAAAEMLLIGILAGFFVSGVLQQLTAGRSRALDEEAYAKMEEAVEQALARKIAEGGFVAAAPGAVVTAAPAAPATVETDEATDADAATDTAEAPAETEEEAPGVPEGELIPLIVTDLEGAKHELEVKSGENLLHAALDREVDLDYSCLDGSCDTCTVRIISGMENLPAVRDEERDMLDDDEIDSGHRLACILNIRGPVEMVQEER